MPAIEVKTQTRFIVLFTSRSLLTWGKSPGNSPGISPRYLPAIYPYLTISPYLLQMLHYGRVCLFPTESRPVEKRDGSPVGDISICPPLHWFQPLYHSQVELSSLNSLKAWGRDKNSTMTLLFSWYWQRRKQQGLKFMVCQPNG